MKKTIKNLAMFLVRQITRYQFGTAKFSFVFQISNFVSLLLLLLTQVGLSLRIRWIVIIYVLIFIFGLAGIVILERLDAWQIEKRQLFNMSNLDLYIDQVEYSSLKIGNAIALTQKERDKKLVEIKKRLCDDKND